MKDGTRVQRVRVLHVFEGCKNVPVSSGPKLFLFRLGVCTSAQNCSWFEWKIVRLFIEFVELFPDMIFDSKLP
jgi:hypothetical protein